jgi:hypothetical protein
MTRQSARLSGILAFDGQHPIKEALTMEPNRTQVAVEVRTLWSNR